MTHRLNVKRIYEPASPADGLRVLVDRLWPRGVTKGEARVDLWLKDVAPSTELRRRFNHRPDLWPEFQVRYRAELAANSALETLRERTRLSDVTLLYAARDPVHNHALVLASVLKAGGLGEGA